jgi:hypothetical protein
MARKITIPITDHNDVCNTGYTVAYKMDGAPYWTTQNMFAPPFEISNLLDDVLYNIRITRQCCDGLASAPLELNINTTILPPPTGFSVTPGAGEVALDWADVTGATSYTLQRAEDNEFTVNNTDVYTGATSAYTDTDVINDETYYYRVKATAPEHADSIYSTILTAIPTD